MHMGLEDAARLARGHVSAGYILECFADVGDEYWFSYCFPDKAEEVLLFAVDKETGDVRPQEFPVDFPYLMRVYEESAKADGVGVSDSDSGAASRPAKAEVGIDGALYREWLDILERNGASPEEELDKFVRQYILFGKFPFDEFHYGDRSPAPSVLDFDEPPLDRIHPRKRFAVEALLTSDIPDSVDQIIIFGSALTARCHERSDLDICIIGDYRLEHENDGTIPGGWLKNIRRELGHKDVVMATPEEYYERYPDFGIYKMIHREGVLVYDRLGQTED